MLATNPTTKKWGGVPTGLTLTSAGSLTGTSTQAGDFAFDVMATDANGVATIGHHVLLIAAAAEVGAGPVAGPLGDDTRGGAYRHVFAAAGGIAYRFAADSLRCPNDGLDTRMAVPVRACFRAFPQKPWRVEE